MDFVRNLLILLSYNIDILKVGEFNEFSKLYWNKPTNPNRY